MNVFLHQHPYGTMALTAFLVNIPFGYLRQGTKKFSVAWFVWVHASIPLIIYLRISLGTSKMFIPAAIAIAVCGQWAGSRLRAAKKNSSNFSIPAANQN